jgi:PAS domain-containing protein
MPDPTDLRTICSALEHFSLPAALGNLNDDALVFWNQAFQKRAGFSEIELAQARLTSLILLDESYSGLVLQDHDPEQVVQFVPCVLKKPLTNEWVPGRALRRKDGILLAMLDLPVGDIAFEGFIRGHLIGREEERDRTRQFFHDILSSKLLVATFVAHEIYQSLAAKRAEEAEEQARVTKLLRELIEDISRSFEEPAMQAEPIPEREVASLDRLLGS